MMSDRDDFEVGEWMTLQFSPWWVFQLIANADTNIDEDESSLLVDVLFGKLEYENPFAKYLLKSVVDEFQHVSQRFMSDQRKAIEGLGEAGALLAAKAAPDDAKAVRDALIDVGSKIAKASGGFEQGEVEMLAKISGALNV